MNGFWQWFWGGFIVTFGAGFARDPLKTLAGCGCLGCGGLAFAGVVLLAISWRLGGLGTLLVLIAAVAIFGLIRRRSRLP